MSLFVLFIDKNKRTIYNKFNLVEQEGYKLNRIIFCYSALKERLADKGFTQLKLSQEIGLSETMLGRKLNYGLPFKSTHILNICDKLVIPSSEIGQYFFDIEYDQNKHYQTKHKK